MITSPFPSQFEKVLKTISDSMGIVPVEGVRGCVDRIGIFRNSQNNDIIIVATVQCPYMEIS